MDPLFVANPSPAEIGEALQMWGELPGKRIRPLLVSAFGDIFVETERGGRLCRLTDRDLLRARCEVS